MLARTALAPRLLLGVLGALGFGCTPARTTFARPPDVATTFDRAASDPKAVEIADKLLAACGGAARWTAAKELKWSENVTGGTEPVTFDEAWDRWNGRHFNRQKTQQGDYIAMHPVFAPGGTAFSEAGSQQQRLGAAETERAISGARERWSFDTAALFMPFLLEEPGTKLAMVGELVITPGQPPDDEIKVTFDPKDPSRSGTYYVIVNRATSLIDQLEIVKAGEPDTKRLGYKVDKWVDVGGLKLPTAFHNLGVASEAITFSNLGVNAEPDESLYVPTVQ